MDMIEVSNVKVRYIHQSVQRKLAVFSQGHQNWVPEGAIEWDQ